MQEIDIRVVPGRTVRDLDNNCELEEGVVYSVKNNVEWRRKLQSGDVVLAHSEDIEDKKNKTKSSK